MGENYKLAITKPEEGAGVAFNAMLSLLANLKISYVTEPVSMDLAKRVLNPETVKNAVAYIKSDTKSIYVKGPGITPTDEQILETIITLEKRNALHFNGSASEINEHLQDLRSQCNFNKSEDDLRKFAGKVKELRGNLGLGSPNAGWRDDTQINLERGTSDKLSQNSLVKPPKWDANTPLRVAAFTPVEGQNRVTKFIDYPTVFTVFFLAENGVETKIASQQISCSTPIRISAFDEKSIKDWAEKELTNISVQTQIAHGTKQTVLKASDATLIKWLQEVLDAKNLSGQIAFFARHRDNPNKLGSLLVDDLFSRLSTSELKVDTLILSPNHSYGEYVRDVWDGIKAAGGFKIASHSEIIRASATRDHYKAIEYKAEIAGDLLIKDEEGNLIASKHLAVGDVAMVTHFDCERVHKMVESVLKTAGESGRSNILFGFGDPDPYYQLVRDELERLLPEYPNLNVELLPAGEATVRYMTAGVSDTVLALNNIYGDFATDIELNGKGTAYSIGKIYDGRGAVELGSGGTAPDLVALWKASGTMRFNPMSFVEGISLALASLAQIMPQGDEKTYTESLAKALEDAIYITTGKGIVLPIVEGKFSKNEDAGYAKVSTQTFVKSVELEALKIIGGEAVKIAGLEKDLQAAIQLDSLLYQADEKYGKQWRELNLAINEKLEKAGKIDPFNPDYSLEIGKNVDIASLDVDKLFELRKATAASA